jgi:transposase-like protein
MKHVSSRIFQMMYFYFHNMVFLAKKELRGQYSKRRWTAEQKKAMVLEAEQLGMSISLVDRKYELHPNQLFRGRKLFHEGELSAMLADEELVPISRSCWRKCRFRAAKLTRRLQMASLAEGIRKLTNVRLSPPDC